MKISDLSNIKKIYHDFNLDKLRISGTSILFTVACAANFKWLRLTDNILPLKQYFHNSFFKNADFILKVIHQMVFPWLNTLIFCWFAFLILNTVFKTNFFYEAKHFFGIINEFIINDIWLPWFLFKSLFFQDFTVPYKLSDLPHHLIKIFSNSDYYLFYFLSVLTISNFIFAPINFKIYKSRKKALEFKRFLNKK